jgi:ATP-dependent helicase HrpB
VRQHRLPGRIIMLEPRRLAARIASFLARQLGRRWASASACECAESRTSSQTRLEIVTEGVLTRMLQQDPELTGVSLVIFDEFHERSLHADTALAFAIESQQGLRDDLKLLVMSATLDGMALERLLPVPPWCAPRGAAFPSSTTIAPPIASSGWSPRLAPWCWRRSPVRLAVPWCSCRDRGR